MGLPPRLALERVAGDPVARRALGVLGDALRRSRFTGADPAGAPDAASGALWALASGAPADRTGCAAALGDALVDLEGAGVVVPWEVETGPLPAGRCRLRGQILPMRSVLTFLDELHPEPESDIVYVGADSIALLRAVWQAGGTGRRAADLGTGQGLLAAALATRYDHVVATDLAPRCVAAAALVPALNPHLAARCSVVRADVAGGLCPRAFDLVVANAPWVPEVPDDAVGDRRRFAAGGPTGFELPRRFLDGAAALLAQGGRAFVACTDLEFDDGRAPLRSHLPALTAAGVDVEVRSTLLDGGEILAWAQQRAPGVVVADHVIVTLRRP